MNGHLSENNFVKEIDEQIGRIKIDGELKVDYMMYIDKFSEERESAREEERTGIAIKLLKLGKMAIEEIAAVTGMDVMELKALAADNGITVS